MGGDLDYDWTLSRDWNKEKPLRDERNQIIKKMLLAGKTVAYRQSGWSMHPKIHSNDLCSYLPVRFDESVNEGDTVFCQPQPNDYFYAHIVKEKDWDRANHCYRYWISNLKGRINGWCHLKHIYGKLVQVIH